MKTKHRKAPAADRGAILSGRFYSQSEAVRAFRIARGRVVAAVRRGTLAALPGAARTRTFEGDELLRWRRAGMP